MGGVTQPAMVYVVSCIEPDGSDVRHIFSTQEKAQRFADQDPRPHVLYDYLLDCPERHEGLTQ